MLKFKLGCYNISAEEVSASTRGAGTTGWVRSSGDIRKGYSEQAHQDVQSSVESPQWSWGYLGARRWVEEDISRSLC